MGQINHIWSMLDDLSQKDPEAYQKFVRNNLEKGKEMALQEKNKYKKDLRLNPQNFLTCVQVPSVLKNSKTEKLSDQEKSLLFLEKG